VEIGFIGRETQDKRFSAEPIWEDTLVLVAGKGHPAAGASDITELSGLPFIGREAGSGTRSIIETHLKAAMGTTGLTLIGEMGSSEAVKEAVMAGMGISILSVHAIRRELEQGLLRIIACAGFPLKRDIFMIFRKQFKPSRHHDLFLECMRSFTPGE